ncbi:MAG TPA: thioesterase family protein [Isosphaeraceae bacterium]|jgi:acyl-CoA thioester hydrolase|nr:thioesterase family protein [Isosphaeraceae bacterium]
MESMPATFDSLAAYPVVIEVPVQWGDQDLFGHVNNTVYFRWCESARIAYGLRIGLAATQHTVAPIMASITCHFRRPVVFPDTVRVGARIVKIGRTSMTMEHVILSESQQAVVADGSAVLVSYNYETRQAIPVPEAVRAAIASLEGQPGADHPNIL